MESFDFKSDWEKPYKVLKMDGLGLKMPSPDFNLDNVVDIMGLFLFYRFIRFLAL